MIKKLCGNLRLTAHCYFLLLILTKIPLVHGQEISNDYGNRALDETSQILVKLEDFGFVDSKEYDNFHAFKRLFEAYKGKNVKLVLPRGDYGVSFTETPRFLLNKRGYRHTGIKIPSGVHLDGSNSTIHVFEKLTARTHVFTNDNWDEGNENIWISNLTILTYDLGHRTKHEDNRINGITFFKVKDSTIENVKIIEGYGYGIWFSGSTYCTVKRSYVSEFEDGIELSNESKNNLIHGNKVELIKDKTRYGNSLLIAFANANKNYFSSNILINNRGTGIKTISNYGAGNNNIFENNIILSSEGGIGVILNGVGNVLRNNIIRVDKEPALVMPSFYIDVKDCVIEGNVLYSNNYPTEPPKNSYGNMTVRIDKSFEGLVVQDNVIWFGNGEPIPHIKKYGSNNVISKIYEP